MKKADKKIFWQKHIDAWSVSGLTQTAYASQHGLSIKQFNYYKRMLLKVPDQMEQNPSIIPVTVVDSSQPVVPPNTTSNSMILTAPNGFKIELKPDFNQRLLKQVLQVLEDITC